MARKYYPIWQKLKREKLCIVSAHPLLFQRIIKGVVNEKDRDAAFKIANDLDYLFLKIEKDSEKHLITFKLKQRVGISDVVVV